MGTENMIVAGLMLGAAYILYRNWMSVPLDLTELENFEAFTHDPMLYERALLIQSGNLGKYYTKYHTDQHIAIPRNPPIFETAIRDNNSYVPGFQ